VTKLNPPAAENIYWYPFIKNNKGYTTNCKFRSSLNAGFNS
jgi:hypothetical protein